MRAQMTAPSIQAQTTVQMQTSNFQMGTEGMEERDEHEEEQDEEEGRAAVEERRRKEILRRRRGIAPRSPTRNGSATTGPSGPMSLDGRMSHLRLAGAGGHCGLPACGDSSTLRGRGAL
jgi:hypothetical protein